MFTYNVTATGPKGFQVSVTGPHPLGTNLIDDFLSLADAEAFAGRMRELDAGRTDITPVPLRADASGGDLRTDELIRRSRELRAAAALARAILVETERKAHNLCSEAAIRREFWLMWWNTDPDARVELRRTRPLH